MKRMDRTEFLDVRQHGFARVAVCVPRVHLADPVANARSHYEQLERSFESGATYAVCPELGLTGYTCGDLFFDDVLRAASLEALSRLASETAAMNMAFTVGAPLAVDGFLLNCALTLYRGRVLAVSPKSYLPNYREFYEARWFAPARDCRARTVDLLGESVPIGNDILLRARHVADFTLHVEICEDLWVPVAPSSLATLAGATVLANLSASNITVAKSEYRRELVVGASARNLAVQLYGAAGFGESTSDLAWDGEGLIAERGRLLNATERFSTTGESAVSDVDLRSLLQDRMRQTSFADNSAEMAVDFRAVEFGDDRESRPKTTFGTFARQIDPHPFVPSDPTRRDDRCREVFTIQATSLARRLDALPEDGRRIVVGVSGGQDSTHALLVAARAVDLAGLGRDRILAITMPGLGTTERTKGNARALATAARCATVYELPISRRSARMCFGSSSTQRSSRTRRSRTSRPGCASVCSSRWLRSIAAIDLGTGDLSELALGWCTYGGDHISHYGVNAGVPKTLITYVIRWSAEIRLSVTTRGLRGVLHDILDTPISPELKRPDAVWRDRSEIGG